MRLMGKSCQIVGIALVLALFAGCGDDDSPADAAVEPDSSVADAAVTTDAQIPDAMPDAIQYDAIPCPAWAPGDVGGTCSLSADCNSGLVPNDGFCLAGTLGGPVNWPPLGFCTRFCSDDTNCGANAYCATLDSNTGFQACMPRCCEGVACPGGQACNDTYFAAETFAEPTCLPGDDDASDGDRCAGFYECNPQSVCLRDQFEQPGGSCQTIGCTIGDDSTCAEGGDGHCVTNPTGGTRCVDPCAQNTDCNEGQGWACVDHGADGLYCSHPEAGDPCAAASQCGNAPPWQCLMGAEFPGGYCTIPNCNPQTFAGCSPGSSICFDPDDDVMNPNGNEYCADRCSIAMQDCRNGYTCVSIGPDNLAGCVPTP